MLFGDIEHFLNIMTSTDKIRLVASTGAQFEIKDTDDIYMDKDSILIIRPDGDRVTVNINYIVFASFLRRWLCMRNELIQLYNKMVEGEKIKIVLSNGLEVYIGFKDAIGQNTDKILIIRDNGVNTVLNPDYVVMVSLIIPRRW